MKWQEYQEAVALLYEQLDGFGDVQRNVYIPDKVTGQRRQIDVLVKISARGHELKLVIDAKFHAEKIDVKDLEEVMALSEAVGGAKCVIVASNGWTEPAANKAEHFGVDLRLLTLENALELFVSENWSMCPFCNKDCIVLDHDGMCEYYGGILWWLAGQCRECRSAFAWCQDCGLNNGIEVGKSVECGCGHKWQCTKDGMSVTLSGVGNPIPI